MDKFYVYAYLDLDGTPFYIGNGDGKRDIGHFSRCRNEKTKNICRRFYAKLREMLDAGIEPPVIHVLENLTLPAARLWEKCLIDDIGRLDLVTGPLTNLKSGDIPGPETRRLMSVASASRQNLPDVKEQRRELQKEVQNR